MLALAVTLYPLVSVSQRETNSGLSNTQATQQAERALKTKDWRKITLLLEKRKSQLGPRGLLVLAEGYIGQNQLTDAVTALDLAIAQNPTHIGAITKRAHVLARDGKSQVAIESLNEARKKVKRSRPLGEALLALLIATDARQESRDLIDDLTRMFGEKPQWLSARCRLAALDAFFEEALEYCEKAIRRDPKNDENIPYLAQAIAERKSKEKAFAFLLREAKKRPKATTLLLAVASNYRERNNYVKALEWYQKAVRRSPKNYDAQIGVAEAAFELQKLDISLQAFKTACALDRKALTPLQGAASRLRARNESKFQPQFEEAVPTCQSVVPEF